MRRVVPVIAALVLAALAPLASIAPAAPTVTVTLGASVTTGPVDGRLLLLLSADATAEPRVQIEAGPKTQQVFGIDVDGWQPGETKTIDADVLGYPRASLRDVPPGEYRVQALLHRYETFRRADGHTVTLPMDRGEGQQWSRAPGNVYSTPGTVRVGADGIAVQVTLDQVIPPIADPPTTKYIRHERIQSERLTRFWGRPMFLGAHILVPEGFDAHPDARYPLVINHGHFPHSIDGFRETPPDPNVKCEYSERFHLDCYNRIQDEQAHQLYKDWTAPGFPRVLVVEIQHANPYYDDSYAVNSANLGPYGDAIVHELIPYLEKKYRALGTGWSRFMYGGSTGGWEAMAAQIFYPDDFNGAYVACPDPIDFRAYTVVDIYKDTNAYYTEGPWARVPRPGLRNSLGHVGITLESMNQMELVLGTKGRSGGQWDIWEAVYSPVGADGYPKRLWDKRTGVIDRTVAEYWRQHFDLSAILRREWSKGLGQKLQGKLNIYVGDMDNYYLNNAVYLVEEFLKSTKDPAYGGEVAYGDRAEHCWNGDPTRPNAYSRLRYHQMFIPKIADRIRKTAPAGADLTSWTY
ncbi:MAG: alpha/beta hydrolase-fold protein [Vicinamibacteraceae bacterium]